MVRRALSGFIWEDNMHYIHEQARSASKTALTQAEELFGKRLFANTDASYLSGDRTRLLAAICGLSAALEASLRAEEAISLISPMVSH